MYGMSKRPVGPVLVLLTLLVSPVLSELLERCCADGEVLSNSSTPRCVSAGPEEVELRAAGDEISAYSKNISSCSKRVKLELQDFERQLRLSLESFLDSPLCFDILGSKMPNETMALLMRCANSSTEDSQDRVKDIPRLPKFRNIRKCCPRGAFYDAARKSCQEMNYNTDDADEFLASLLPVKMNADYWIVEKGFPHCEDVLFDYDVHPSELMVNDDTVHLMGPTKNSLQRDKVVLTEENSCFDTTGVSRRLVVRVCRALDVCEERMCLRKCCPEDEIYVSRVGCAKINELPVGPVEFHESLRNVSRHRNFDATNYGIIYGKPCASMYLIGEEQWTLTDIGHLAVPTYIPVSHKQSCMDTYHNNSQYRDGLYPFVCFGENKPQPRIRFIISTALLVPSAICLLITFLVYACLPSLRNLYGKTLMCHVASLFVAYVCLAIVGWMTPVHHLTICTSIGFIMLYAFLSSFSWLNIMCFDIWWTFGGVRGSTNNRGRSHMKRFLLYCLYAYGLPLTITLLGLAADYGNILPDYLRPTIGQTSCWFMQSEYYFGEMAFFIGPISIQLVTNLVFFVLTSMHCSKVKADLRKFSIDPLDPRRRKFHADKTQLTMLMKLFVVMGMSWILEVVSSFLNHYAKEMKYRDELFYTADVYNCLQGVVIFILFVMKRRVWHALQRRLGFDDKKKTTSNATAALQDPFRVKKSSSNTTITSTFAVSTSP